MKKLNHNDKSALKEVYSTIDGAYALIEKMIHTYYNPEAVKFFDAQKALTFSDQEGAYAMIHFLLAGDFFVNQEKYNKVLDILSSEKKIEGFFHLIDQKEMFRGALCE